MFDRLRAWMDRRAELPADERVKSAESDPELEALAKSTGAVVETRCERRPAQRRRPKLNRKGCRRTGRNPVRSAKQHGMLNKPGYAG